MTRTAKSFGCVKRSSWRKGTETEPLLVQPPSIAAHCLSSHSGWWDLHAQRVQTETPNKAPAEVGKES